MFTKNNGKEYNHGYEIKMKFNLIQTVVNTAASSNPSIV